MIGPHLSLCLPVVSDFGYRAAFFAAAHSVCEDGLLGRRDSVTLHGLRGMA